LYIATGLPNRARRTREVPFIAGCSHFTRKTQGFVLRLPPQYNPHGIFFYPLHLPLPKIITSQNHHNPFFTTSLGRHTHFVTTILAYHRLPSSPRFLRHHFPRPPHSLRHHFPTSSNFLRRRFPISPRPPFVTASLRHALRSLRRLFPRSPRSLRFQIPFVSSCLIHHHSPLIAISLGHAPAITAASLGRPISFISILPLSSCPFVTASLGHHFRHSSSYIVT
jgi:hypothetical protein